MKKSLSNAKQTIGSTHFMEIVFFRGFGIGGGILLLRLMLLVLLRLTAPQKYPSEFPELPISGLLVDNGDANLSFSNSCLMMLTLLAKYS